MYSNWKMGSRSSMLRACMVRCVVEDVMHYVAHDTYPGML